MRLPIDLRHWLGHWREYLIEAASLGLFMISAAAFTVVLEHPASPVRQAVADAAARRLVMGLAMGATAVAIIYSPFGARSGAHMNPAVTLTFFRLGKIGARDAVAYIAMHFLGAVAGLWLASRALAPFVSHPAVSFVATRPGPWGAAAAGLVEIAMAFVMMTTVLTLTAGRHARWTGAAAGALVALYILLAAPISGMSLNPARSFAPALLSGDFSGLGLYFASPPAGMLLAAEVFARRRGLHAVLCAKLNHAGAFPCIFGCGPAAASSSRA